MQTEKSDVNKRACEFVQQVSVLHLANQTNYSAGDNDFLS